MGNKIKLAEPMTIGVKGTSMLSSVFNYYDIIAERESIAKELKRIIKEMNEWCDCGRCKYCQKRVELCELAVEVMKEAEI